MTILQKLLPGNFKKNVLLITGGTALAQLLNFVASPIITRLYSPDDYGLVAAYASIITVATTMGSFNYEMGIPIAKDDREAVNILILCVGMVLSFSGLIALSVFFFGDAAFQILGMEDITEYKYLIPISLCLVGFMRIAIQWTYRRKYYKALTIVKLSQSFSQNILSIFWGIFITKTPIGLLLGRLIGQIAAVVPLIYPFKKKDSQLLLLVSVEGIVSVAKKYRNFFFFTAPRRLIDDVIISLPVIFLTSMFGAIIVGYFSLANSVIQVPMGIIGASIGNVFYAESASLRRTNPGEIERISKNLLKILLSLSVIPVAILMAWGPELFSLVFGDGWLDAGNYARLMCIGVFSGFIFKTVSNILDIFEKQKMAFWLSFFRLIIVILVFVLSRIFHLDSYFAVGLYSWSIAITYFIHYILAQKIIRLEMKKFP